ncbi:sigma-54-dependent Fis family transcriptional regulator [Limnohabitans sp. T6-20]|jgi:sigma-54 specific flagellar transcriptional regulator A|uniref:sigma-54 interaction domain-containing protein n=1 Tax=Limnohabitans sp. T6-20 TaxID=1100725 RepID=UPI000D3C6DAF|nr:sigma-54 dependent transcriptional regulator [Limnohabitans sp. T6-20]PUE10223.1 sigma-54-dependent Fis family transcriptional regulator [Limnohabitans sp. T6-20]
MKTNAKPRIIGESQATLFLRELIKTLSASSSTALITGESGTGKELVAQALHMQGPRASGPFVPINCGAIPRDLIESELFGHRKGSFTGAVADRLGRFELAHGGTLFLDEIGDLPMDMQVKLLRVLQERCILPVGASREVPIDVRVVAATHKKLEAEVEAGRFREDLYYRINVLPVTTTPLRERPEDVAALLNFYAEKHALPQTKAVRFSPEMTQMLQAYAWPGNVRELSNLVDRFSTLYPSQLLQIQTVPACMMPLGLAALQTEWLARHGLTANALTFPPSLSTSAAVSVVVEMGSDVDGPFPFSGEDDPMAHLLSSPSGSFSMPTKAPSPAPLVASNDEINDVEQAILLAQGIQTLPPQGMSLKQHLVEVERSLIEQALARTQGNVSQTAKLLQLQRTTLIEKINKYELRSVA